MAEATSGTSKDVATTVTQISSANDSSTDVPKMMFASSATIDEMTTDADSSEPEPDDRPPPSPPFSALCRCLEALERGPKPGGPPPSADLRTAILRSFFSLRCGWAVVKKSV